jgi:hypothetical protein
MSIEDEEPSLADLTPKGSLVIELEGQLERQLNLPRWEKCCDSTISIVRSVGIRILVVH